MNQQRENMFHGKKLFSDGGEGWILFKFQGGIDQEVMGGIDQYLFLEGDSPM